MITFDGVELKHPEPFEIDPQVIVNETVLLSGKRSLQSSSETAVSVTIKCHTDTISDVTNLRAKIGTEGSLVVDSTTYTKCHISAWSEVLWSKGKWEYTVGFKQDTT
ncbi:MAG: hypothetical protein HF975_04480 [ANME-2 cluster archaeon]|nr:hypothetical protein [ANME-2 cluster archaeon]